MSLLNLVKPMSIQMDGDVRATLEQVREAIVRRNVERTLRGEHDRYEGATYKEIIQRGVIAVAREVLETM